MVATVTDKDLQVLESLSKLLEYQQGKCVLSHVLTIVIPCLLVLIEKFVKITDFVNDLFNFYRSTITNIKNVNL